jgi:hypothetical protein
MILIDYHPDDKGLTVAVYDRLKLDLGQQVRLRDWEREPTGSELGPFDIMLLVIGANDRKYELHDLLHRDIEVAISRHRRVIVLLEEWPWLQLNQIGLELRPLSELPRITQVLESEESEKRKQLEAMAEAQAAREKVLEAAEEGLTRGRRPWWGSRVKKKAKFKARRGTLDEVHLGASTPSAVSPGEAFVARFAAYTDATRDKVQAIIRQEAPSSKLSLDLAGH